MDYVGAPSGPNVGWGVSIGGHDRKKRKNDMQWLLVHWPCELRGQSATCMQLEPTCGFIACKDNTWGPLTHETEGPWPLYFKHSRWWKRRSRSKSASHYTRGTKRSMCMQDGCKACMDSYMVSNGLCFIFTWTIFKNHFLEVGLTQNHRETMTPNAHNCWFIIFLSSVRTRVNRQSLK